MPVQVERSPGSLTRGLKFRYSAIMMKRSSVRIPGKHRKCRVPECHLPRHTHRDTASIDGIHHCVGDPHVCGRPNIQQQQRLGYFDHPIRTTVGEMKTEPSVEDIRFWTTAYNEGNITRQQLLEHLPFPQPITDETDPPFTPGPGAFA